MIYAHIRSAYVYNICVYIYMQCRYTCIFIHILNAYCVIYNIYWYVYVLIYINTYALYTYIILYIICECIYILYMCEYIHIYHTEYVKCIISISALLAQMVQNLPAVWETWVWSLGWEDPVEEGVTTPDALYSCLENPMDRGAWRATVRGIAKSQTWQTDSAQHITHSQDIYCIYAYWIGQKVWSGFSVRCFGKTQMNAWDNPICITCLYIKSV